MLTDSEIQQLAEAHVRDRPRAGEVTPAHRLTMVRACELKEPPGIYFIVGLEPPDDILLGPGGFFVSRDDGSIRTFASLELIWALAGGGEITPTVVQRMLSPDPNSPIPAGPILARIPPSRKQPWWRFWD